MFGTYDYLKIEAVQRGLNFLKIIVPIVDVLCYICNSMDADLMFDVLMYLNLYYFPVFLVCESCVVFGKYISPNLWTPNIGKDAGVMGAMVMSELIKLVIHRKLKDNKKGTAS